MSSSYDYDEPQQRDWIATRAIRNELSRLKLRPAEADPAALVGSIMGRRRGLEVSKQELLDAAARVCSNPRARRKP
jgi:hypothetical protein